LTARIEAAVAVEGVPEQTPVLREKFGIDVPARAGQDAGRALDVGEKKRHRAAGGGGPAVQYLVNHMSADTALALLLALAPTTLPNLAYRREHDAAAALPALSLRRPLHSAHALLTDRSWLMGFALEGAGFALYVAALALAPLSLVQSVAAGGIGILALASPPPTRRRLGRHLPAGVLVSI